MKFNKGSLLLKTQERKKIIKTIKQDSTLSSLCYEMVDEFNEFIACLKGLVILSVDYEEYKHASELGKKYLLLPSDALHASVMETNKIRNIATRDGDFDRIEGITVWKQ